MSNAYDIELRNLAKKLGKEMGFESFLREGVYSMLVGPNFETVSECLLLRKLGSDATGLYNIYIYLIYRYCIFLMVSDFFKEYFFNCLDTFL